MLNDPQKQYIPFYNNQVMYIISSIRQFFAINAKIENIVFLITLKVKKVFF